MPDPKSPDATPGTSSISEAPADSESPAETEAEAVQDPSPEQATPEQPASEQPSVEAETPEPLPHRATSLPEAKEITRAQAQNLRALVAKYVRRHLPAPSPKPTVVHEPPRMVGAHARALPFLRLVPWLLGLLFAASFVWDFSGVVFQPFGYTLALEGLLRILAVSGLIGFVTNWLAITMLFQPRAKRPIFGQGLIPAQRERVIYRLAKAVSEELINEEIIKQKIEESQVIPRYREMALNVTRGVLEDPEFRQDVKTLAADYVEQVLGSEDVRRKIAEFTVQKVEEHAGQGISGLALKMYRFVNEDDFQRRIDKAIRELPNSLDDAMDQIDHLLDRVPEKLEARSEDIEQWATQMVLGFVEKLDVYSMIIGNMRQYDEHQLERLLKNTSNEQLNYIKYLGGILGCLGGLVIWEPLLSLSIFGVIGLALYGLDLLLYRSQSAA